MASHSLKSRRGVRIRLKYSYSRSDCSGVRTRTVTCVESDWPMESVTVSWNLYVPDVRFETMT